MIRDEQRLTTRRRPFRAVRAFMFVARTAASAPATAESTIRAQGVRSLAVVLLPIVADGAANCLTLIKRLHWSRKLSSVRARVPSITSSIRCSQTTVTSGRSLLERRSSSLPIGFEAPHRQDAGLSDLAARYGQCDFCTCPQHVPITVYSQSKLLPSGRIHFP